MVVAVVAAVVVLVNEWSEVAVGDGGVKEGGRVVEKEPRPSIEVAYRDEDESGGFEVMVVVRWW